MSHKYWRVILLKNAMVHGHSQSYRVKKKTDGFINLCVDFRKLNLVTVDKEYYMPLIEDVLDQIKNFKYLSKVDLTKGFYQIPVKPDDRDKTGFCTSWGKFRFKRMPFGFKKMPQQLSREQWTVFCMDKRNTVQHALMTS